MSQKITTSHRLAKRIAGVLALAAALVAAPAAAFADHGISTTATVNIRSGPSTSYSILGTVPAGVSPTYICWTQGQNINGVDVWFKMTYSGVTGYISSYYDNSSYSTDSAITSKYGINNCSNMTTSQPPSSTAAQKAISWAQSKMGSTAWDGLCLNFVYQAYLYGAGVDITAGLPYSQSHDTAYTYWTVAPNHHTDWNPPAGALVFWRSVSSPTGAGHVGLSLGGGTIISSYDGRTHGIHTFNIYSYQQNLYLGWVKNF